MVFNSLFQPKLPYVSHISVAWPVYHVILNFITLIILGDQYKLQSSSMHNILHSPVTLYLFGPNSQHTVPKFLISLPSLEYEINIHTNKSST